MKLKLKKKHKKESSKWLNRHINDEFVLKSKKEGFRSRSSYKLIQINEKFDFLNSSKNILDLGCAPGGWLQVSKKFSLVETKILGVDKLNIEAIPGVCFYQGDIFEDKVINYIETFFKKKIDLIMSDMSPNSTGNKKVDHLRILSLVERVIFISNQLLQNDGFIVIKIFQGGMQGDLMNSMKGSLKNIKNFKPKASRKESPEMYLIAQKK
ncbi:MAG: rRNA methyltransferase [Rickettsiales bacterium]|nr:rRNA methyltransferase [Rickettsiales bacterium]RPG15068.1 MAG: RlmE family RNA methyltransferase [Pelagibacteraceae bacterium TMED195]|tara:strand:+ start:7575 stop:8204 length:630 start_codon:yes stop_codon:yes gene_type:complete